jgi:nicotinate-nucleotide adenylyltransferase
MEHYTTSRRQTGVLGGSFNPVHHAHLILAQDVLESFELDRVIFVPCGRPAHKPNDDLAEARHRLAMLELAVEFDHRFEVSDVEIQREGVSYTIDTLDELSRRWPKDQFSFLLGSDSLPELRTWHRIEELVDRYRFLSQVRPRYDLNRLQGEDLGLGPERQAWLLEHVIDGHLIEISASEIRMRVAEGMSIRYLVPPEVEMYIFEHGLYRG